MNYFQKAASGIYWTGALRACLRVFAIVRTIILARLLVPAHFGIYGIASLTLALLETLTETGINIFLVQEKDSDSYINTAWIVSIARGTIISLLLIFSSRFIASFFKSPSSLTLLLLISLVAFIRGFVNPSVVTFQKNLKFNKEFQFRSALFLIEAAVTVASAFITRSAASFVYGHLASSICEVAYSLVFIKPRPRFSFIPKKLRLILHRGKWLTAAGIFDYLYHNLDNIVIGRLLGVAPLGLYDTSYKISSLPITEVSEVFSKVTFPIYVQIGNDRHRLARAFIKSTIAQSVLVIPFGLFLFFFPQIIVILLGSKWAPAVPTLRLLSVYGVIRSISGSSSALFLAMHKANFVTYVTLASIVGLGITIIPFVTLWGISGAAASAIVGSVASLPLIAYFLLAVFKKSHETG